MTKRKVDMFADEFAALVRKYVPVFPASSKAQFDMFVSAGIPASRLVVSARDSLLLAEMQDQTSCFSPYVWSEKFDPKQPENDLPDDYEVN